MNTSGLFNYEYKSKRMKSLLNEGYEIDIKDKCISLENMIGKIDTLHENRRTIDAIFKKYIYAIKLAKAVIDDTDIDKDVMNEAITTAKRNLENELMRNLMETSSNAPNKSLL
jgi:hypothetical protein